MAVEKQMIPSEVDVEDTEEVQIEVVNPDAVGISMDGESMVNDSFQKRFSYCVVCSILDFIVMYNCLLIHASVAA